MHPAGWSVPVYNSGMMDPESRERIQNELQRGYAARQDGLEGRARVCARRAAGEAARVYFTRLGLATANQTAYDLLARLAAAPDISPEIRRAAERLLLRVGEDYHLPAEIDLLADARLIIDSLDGSDTDAITADEETIV